MKLSKVVLNLFLILLLACAFMVGYALAYHNGPPIPQLDNFFKTVKYEIYGGELGDLGEEGLYQWELTNLNNFAWPNLLIKYGEHHLFFGWEAIEPGQTVAFSNLFLANIDTNEVETVPFEKGQSVSLKLGIDFSDEDSWPSRFWKALGLNKQETYFLGTWSR